MQFYINIIKSLGRNYVNFVPQKSMHKDHKSCDVIIT